MNQKAGYSLLIAAFAAAACSNAASPASSAAAGAAGSTSSAGAGVAQAGQPSSGSGGAPSMGGAPSVGGAGASAVSGAGGAAGSGVAGSAGASGSAGTSSSAGASGSAGSAGASGNSSTCAGLLCDDFEQGMIDPTKWDLKVGAGGTAEVQTVLVAHGKYALHVHALANNNNADDYALLVSKSAPAGLSGTHFGRVNFYITPKPLTSGHTSMVFAGRNGTGAANGPGPFPKLRYMEVSNIGGGWQAGIDLLDVNPLLEKVMYPAGSPQVPTTVWTCLEWQFSDAPDSTNFWINGKLIGTFDDQHVSYPPGVAPGTPLYNGSSTGLVGGFELFGVGFHDWHPNKAFDLYYDDFVLDTQRVNCLP